MSRWKRLLPQLSYRGRVLVINNLVASSLWHKLQVLVPPPGLLEALQRLLVDFFWSGHHWLRAAVLYLPVAEGGQGLIHIKSRTAAFRLQAAQKLLYGCAICWSAPARLILRKAGRLGLDKQLFLMNSHCDLTGITPFYRSVLDAWRTLNITRPPDPRPGMWLYEEPLFNNSFLDNDMLSSATLRARFVEAGVVKLGHLMKMSVEQLTELIKIRSTRVMRKLVDEVGSSLSGPLRAFVRDLELVDQWDEGHEYGFPSLIISPAVGEWREASGMLLSLKTPALGEFISVGSKPLYQSCVKVLNIASLTGLKESKWTEVFDTDSSPKGCWRVLYKPPVEKRMADLQWRIIHGILATNRYRAHLDPSTEGGCPFCRESETVEHLVVSCPRLAGLFRMVQGWVEALGEVFSLSLFVFGPRYTMKKKQTLVLINFLLATAKLAIWKSRKNQMSGDGWTDPVLVLKALVSVRLKIEHSFYTLTCNMEGFEDVWGVRQVLCSVGEDGSLQLSF